MNRRRTERPSLQDRIHGTTTQAPADPVRRCWVHGHDGRVPGLLLEWRRTTNGWIGRVVHPVREGTGWVVADEWLPARLLERAE